MTWTDPNPTWTANRKKNINKLIKKIQRRVSSHEYLSSNYYTTYTFEQHCTILSTIESTRPSYHRDTIKQHDVILHQYLGSPLPARTDHQCIHHQ